MFSPSLYYLKMNSGGEFETQDLEFQKLDEFFEDRDGGIFSIVLYFGSILQLETKLYFLKDQEIDLHSIF